MLANRHTEDAPMKAPRHGTDACPEPQSPEDHINDAQQQLYRAKALVKTFGKFNAHLPLGAAFPLSPDEASYLMDIVGDHLQLVDAHLQEIETYFNHAHRTGTS
jgi:hypothetical protein